MFYANYRKLSAAAYPPPGKTKGGNNANNAAVIEEDGPHRLDIRVGKVVEVSRHPDADTLYVLKIDLGVTTTYHYKWISEIRHNRRIRSKISSCAVQSQTV